MPTYYAMPPLMLVAASAAQRQHTLPYAIRHTPCLRAAFSLIADAASHYAMMMDTYAMIRD